MSVRVRFAPSPTGYLHIGGIRTALYAWLWARQHNGVFVLRIEDTDVERNTQEAVEIVTTSMRWLGLDWDEGPEVGGAYGPYFQSERKDIYQKWALRLIEDGHAYRCYAGKEEIALARAKYESEHRKKGFRFRSPWRDRNDGDPSAPHVVRFRVPDTGETSWEDCVYGHVAYPNTEQQDFVLLRSNGLPLYNFGCFVDDMTMEISLVTRGEDHLINTPQQILLFEAVGKTPPQYAHLPLVLGSDSKKLSKRHASVSVLEYRDAGYVPDGVLNYLARLGWSHGDQEIFSREELITKFSWKHVGTKSANWDQKKLEHVQAQHLRRIDDQKLAKLVVPFLKERELSVEPDDQTLINAIGPVQLRATTLRDLAVDLDYFFRDDDALSYEEKGKRKFLTPEFAPNLERLAEIVEQTDPFTEDALEIAISTWMKDAELKMKHVAQPARVAISGRTRSPGLYETIILLGKERTLRRLRKGVDLARASE